MGKKQREKFKVFPNSFPSVTKDGVYPVEFLGCADFRDFDFWVLVLGVDAFHRKERGYP